MNIAPRLFLHSNVPFTKRTVCPRNGMVSYPRSEDAIALLQKLGVRALLSLSEESLSADLLRKYQLQREHLPVADFTAPTLEQVEQALAIIDGFLVHGLPVAVHCGAGLGRTGTILACYLVSQGSSAKDAIPQVRTRRPSSIETPEQEAVHMSRLAKTSVAPSSLKERRFL